MTRQVTDIYTQWMKRTRRDQPLPPYVSEATLMQRLNSIFEAAQRLVTEAFVDPNALYRPILRDGAFFEDYEYPWQIKEPQDVPFSTLTEAMERALLASWDDPEEDEDTVSRTAGEDEEEAL